MRDSFNNKSISPKTAVEQLTADVQDKSADKETTAKEETRNVLQNAAAKRVAGRTRSRQEILESKLASHLHSYSNATSTTMRSTALANIVNIACTTTTNEPLDTILTFFREHKSDLFLQETVGLQGVMSMRPDVMHKAMLFYTIFRGLSKNEYTRENIQMEKVRNVFRSDTFVNWLTAKLPRFKYK